MWLGVLTIVVIALVRQVAVVAVRLETGTYSPELREGPEIGSDLPDDAVEALASLNGGPRRAVSASGRLSDGPAYLLFVSPSCSPCLEITSDLARHELRRPVLALFSGKDRMADEYETAFPPTVRTVRDPVATQVAQALGVSVTPFALQIENNVVTGKAHLEAAEDLIRLIDAYEISGAADLAKRGGVTDGR
jgi:thiol-disulfide isomerase/thioredoxin